MAEGAHLIAEAVCARSKARRRRHARSRPKRFGVMFAADPDGKARNLGGGEHVVEAGQMRRLGELGASGIHLARGAQHIDQQELQTSEAAMKLNMIVVITMWLPRLACRIGRDEAQAAPNSACPRWPADDRQASSAAREYKAQTSATPRPPSRAWPSPPMLNIRAWKATGHGQPGEDEIGGVVERVAPRAGRTEERALDHQARDARRGFRRWPASRAPEISGRSRIENRGTRTASAQAGILRPLTAAPLPRFGPGVSVMPAIRRPSSPSSVLARQTFAHDPAIEHHCDPVRERPRISSSSTETSRMALP